jgi:ABC-type Fe3+-hydroxamate transport system substrate-binding protein
MPFITNIEKANYKRIVSVVPSLTELLYSLGMDEEVIGITKFCVHPRKWFDTKKRVGGTKKLNIDLIRSLQPDLIIANKEENVKEQVEALAEGTDVYLTDINSLEEAIEAIVNIGILLDREQEAKKMAESINEEFIMLRPSLTPHRSCYLIWKEPYMTIGGDTFINDMMKRCGLQNVFEVRTRYPEITVQDIKDSGCELVLLSSEPYPFKEKHIKELQQVLPGTKIALADGEMFSWYGSRLTEAPTYFKELLKSLGY